MGPEIGELVQHDYILNYCSQKVEHWEKSGRVVLTEGDIPDFIIPVPNPTFLFRSSARTTLWGRYYSRRAQVILLAPHIFWNHLYKAPKCTCCHSAESVIGDGWASELRKVVGISRVYYVLPYRYICKKCVPDEQGKPTQHIFRSTTPGALDDLPDLIKLQIPINLTKKTGVTNSSAGESLAAVATHREHTADPTPPNPFALQAAHGPSFGVQLTLQELTAYYANAPNLQMHDAPVQHFPQISKQPEIDLFWKLLPHFTTDAGCALWKEMALQWCELVDEAVKRPSQASAQYGVPNMATCAYTCSQRLQEYHEQHGTSGGAASHQPPTNPTNAARQSTQIPGNATIHAPPHIVHTVQSSPALYIHPQPGNTSHPPPDHQPYLLNLPALLQQQMAHQAPSSSNQAPQMPYTMQHLAPLGMHLPANFASPTLVPVLEQLGQQKFPRRSQGGKGKAQVCHKCTEATGSVVMQKDPENMHVEGCRFHVRKRQKLDDQPSGLP